MSDREAELGEAAEDALSWLRDGGPDSKRADKTIEELAMGCKELLRRLKAERTKAP